MLKESVPLIEILKQIPDNRSSQGKRHKLYSILALSICAIICGYKSYGAISEWGKHYGKELAEKFGFKNGKTPCQSTFYNVFKIIDVNLFEKKICQWIEENISTKDKNILSIDGKTLRGTRKQGSQTHHFISAFSHKLGITLFQCGVNSKTNEIKGVQDLLKGLILEGKIITMDALLTQTKVAKNIKKENGDYVMIVKDNQPTLKEDIKCALIGEEKFGEVKSYSSIDKGHGRIEFRKITVCQTVPFIDWYGDKQVFKIEREIKRKEKTSLETVYGITSLESSPEELLNLVRGHWSIENKSHWIRDVVYDEDRNQVKNSVIGQMMASLRNLSISLIRLSGRNSISSSCRYFSANPVLAMELIGFI